MSTREDDATSKSEAANELWDAPSPKGYRPPDTSPVEEESAGRSSTTPDARTYLNR